MGRLKQLATRVGAAPSRLARVTADAEGRRLKSQAGVEWYRTARWQRLRWSALVAALFTCARCGRIEADTSQLVADHRVPHRGEAALFWDPENLQCLCKPCHDGAKQREERSRPR